jgi:hypothetical protein
MVNSPPSPPAASSPQFAVALAVPPARMSVSRCLSSDGTIIIEKYRLYRQSAAAVLWRHSSVTMDSLLDPYGCCSPSHDEKETRSQRCPCVERNGGWPAGDYFAGGFTVVQSLRQQFFDAGTRIVHDEEIPREVSSSVSQFPAIGSVCLQKQTYILHVVDRHVGTTRRWSGSIALSRRFVLLDRICRTMHLSSLHVAGGGR